jgi:hypothetical protein
MSVLAYVSPLHSSVGNLVLELSVNDDLSSVFYFSVSVSLVRQVRNQRKLALFPGASEISPVSCQMQINEFVMQKICKSYKSKRTMQSQKFNHPAKRI